MKVTVINVVAFKVAWLLTVFAAAAGHGLMGPLAVTCWVGCFLYWQQDLKPVSYTHLPLPTSDLV